MKIVINITIKILILTILFLTLYYFFIVKPKVLLQKDIAQTRAVLSSNYTILVQNRLAYIELTRLNPSSANFQYQTANTIDVLQKTQKEGLDLAKEKKTIPDLKNFDINFPKLLTETESVYRQQEDIIKKVTETEKYEDGLKILKSDESVKLLTTQTNLILEYEFWLEKINELLISN